jgi:hypothetical protein
VCVCVCVRVCVRPCVCSHGVAATEGDLKASLLLRARAIDATTRKLEAVEIARVHGHTVVFTPKHHNELHETEALFQEVRHSLASDIEPCASVLEARTRVVEQMNAVSGDSFLQARLNVQRYEVAYWQELDGDENDDALADVPSDDDSVGFDGMEEV